MGCCESSPPGDSEGRGRCRIQAACAGNMGYRASLGHNHSQHPGYLQPLAKHKDSETSGGTDAGPGAQEPFTAHRRPRPTPAGTPLVTFPQDAPPDKRVLEEFSCLNLIMRQTENRGTLVT